MKKLFTLFALAGTLVACNDGANGDDAADSTVTTVTTDSNMMTTPMDTTMGMGATMDSTSRTTTDSMPK